MSLYQSLGLDNTEYVSMKKPLIFSDEELSFEKKIIIERKLVNIRDKIFLLKLNFLKKFIKE